MNQISLLIENYKVPVIAKKRTSERAEIVQEFVGRLNFERKDNKDFKPLSPGFVAFKISHLTIPELYEFYKTCCNSKSGFSKCWWGALKVRDSLSPLAS